MALSTKAENQRANYDQIAFRVPKGNKIALQLEAAKRGKTMNEIIVEALEKQYNLNLSEKNQQSERKCATIIPY